jgi:non-heme chloroperoxidase
MLKSDMNPFGRDLSEFDEMRGRLIGNRSQFFKEIATKFYSSASVGPNSCQGLREGFWRQAMQAGLKTVFDCIAAFSETDLTTDLKAITVPTLILHGGGDQVSPVEASAMVAAQLVKGSQIKIYQGAGHGICETEKDCLNSDLLVFMTPLPA